MTCRITLLAFNDCLASAVVGSKALFCAANMIATKLDPSCSRVFETRVATLHGRAVRSASGDRIESDVSVADALPAQLIVVPGISVIEPEALISALTRLAPLTVWLRQQYAGGSRLAATCTGVFLLAESGLLNGRRATTTSWFSSLFEERYPGVRFDDSGTIVSADRITCSGGALSYVDLTLHLIEQLASRELARACARYVIMDNRRGAQAPELIRNHAKTYDPLVTKADRWMRANIKRHIRAQDVAEYAAVSARTLMRRFKESTGATPQEHLQKLRLEAGKALLANSRLSLDQILDRIGYQDDSAFRRLFKRHTNLSPREYRQRFGRAS